jgi:serine/threonine protein kinase
MSLQLADALAHVHAAGITSGDLRSDNVVVTTKGTVKLLDVGLADWLSDAAQITPYTAPEQALNGPIDHRIDIFSLGVLLYELLTGKPPFLPTPPSHVTERTPQTAPRPSAVNPVVPRALDRIVARMLAKSADARYQTMSAVAADLRGALDTLDAPGAPAAQSALRARRWIIAVTALAAFVALLWLAMRA